MKCAKEYNEIFDKAVSDGHIPVDGDNVLSSLNSIHQYGFDEWLFKNQTVKNIRGHIIEICTYDNFLIYIKEYYKDQEIKLKSASNKKEVDNATLRIYC